ncbi:MAG: OmpH family outer membrane protein [Gemmatimonadota bacterium]
MRKTFLITLAGLAVSASAAVAQAPAQQAAAATKVAYINSQKLIAEAPGAAEARTTIEKEANKHRADLALAEDSLRNVVTEYQKKQLVLSADARTKEEAAIRTKQEALQARAGQLEQQMSKRQNDLVKPIMDRINEVLTAMRAEGGYAIILDSSSGAIVAADPALDLTDQVLVRLKASAAAPPTANKP